MILKLKIYIVSNYESRKIANELTRYLDSKYYDVICFQQYDNYILDSIAMSNIIKSNPKNNIGFMFCNNANNLWFLTQSLVNIKNYVVNSNIKLHETLFLNTNILSFSIDKLSKEEIIKIIDYYLKLFEQNKLFY